MKKILVRRYLIDMRQTARKAKERKGQFECNARRRHAALMERRKKAMHLLFFPPVAIYDAPIIA